MSKFGEPTECRNSCGQLIYFDRNSERGHPTADKWIPLQYDKESGIKTDEPHNCPKSPFYAKAQQSQQPQQQPQQHQVTVQMSKQQQQDHGQQTDLALEISLISQKLDKVVSLLTKETEQ